MTRARDVYYVATPIKDLAKPHVTSVQGKCLQCKQPVWIHVMMAPIAKKAKGIICVPCVIELTNMTLEELVKANADHMTEVLDREIAIIKKKGPKRW